MNGGGSIGKISLRTRKFLSFSPISLVLVYRFHPLVNEHDPILSSQGPLDQPTIVRRHNLEEKSGSGVNGQAMMTQAEVAATMEIKQDE